MKITPIIRKFIAPVAMLSLISTPLWAANPNSEKHNFADVQADANNVYFVIDNNIQFESIKLILSAGKGGPVIESESDLEPSTGPLEDGGYKYELVVKPLLKKADKEELKAIRKEANGQKLSKSKINALKSSRIIPANRLVQSGFFTILDSQLVTAEDASE